MEFYKGKERCEMKNKVVILTGMVFLLLSGCGEAADAERGLIVVPELEQQISYSTVTVKRGDVTSTKSVICTYQQQEETSVTVNVSGKLVSEIKVEKGDKVSEGDLLIKLGGSDLEERIREAEYKIERNKVLLSAIDDKESYAAEDLEDEIYIDELKLKALYEELEGSRIFAPAAGTVTWIKGQLKGSTSAEGEKVMTIVDETSCIFTLTKNRNTEYLKKDENVLMRINIGSAAGTYELMPVNTGEWGDKLYYALTDDYRDASIPVGTSGYIDVVLAHKENVLKLPANVIHDIGEEHYVYVPGENNVREMRYVTTGIEGDDGTEILSGLSEGDVVLR